jgi:hypothetical protein
MVRARAMIRIRDFLTIEPLPIVPTYNSGAGGMDICVDTAGCRDLQGWGRVDFFGHTVHRALLNLTSQGIAETNMLPYSGRQSTDQLYYWRAVNPKVVDFGTSHYELRDRMAFEMAEQGNVGARDVLLRIAQRDFKLARAERLVRVLDGAVAGD